MKRLLLALLLALPSLAQNDEEFEKAVFFATRFAELGEYVSAQEHFEKANALRPDHPAVLYNLAVVLARAGRYADAQARVDRYVQLYPEGAERANVAKLQLELEFQRELQKKRQADQEYADLFKRARLTYTRGELAEALALFRRAEEVRPNDAAAVYNQAAILEKQGELEPAIERYRRAAELEPDAAVDERVIALQREVEDMRTKILCSFCGRRLDASATWCERCWHGPYAHVQPCPEGASATRVTAAGTETLPCVWNRESLRYSAARQRAIRDARTAEGWTYDGDLLLGNGELRYHHGPRHLERITSAATGEIVEYDAHAAGTWLLDREDLVLDGMRFLNEYTYDDQGRVVQQRVSYVNTAACNHQIAMTAEAAYDGDMLAYVTIVGGYEGYAAEGKPLAEWQAEIAFAYDEQGRPASEELNVTSFEKIYTQRAVGELRGEIARLHPGMRVNRPVENVQRTGDFCAPGLSNPIDLRPFYALLPNLAMQLPNGSTKATVTFTY